MAVEILRHIVNPLQNEHIWQEGMTSQDVIDVAGMSNRHVVTICGERFYPKGKRPNKVCDECLKIALELTKDSTEETESNTPSES